VDDDGWDNEGDFSVNISSDEEFVAPRNPDVVDLFGLFPFVNFVCEDFAVDGILASSRRRRFWDCSWYMSWTTNRLSMSPVRSSLRLTISLLTSLLKLTNSRLPFSIWDDKLSSLLRTLSNFVFILSNLISKEAILNRYSRQKRCGLKIWRHLNRYFKSQTNSLFLQT
jgi:hypothetical protein